LGLVDDLFVELDRLWLPPADPKIRLKLIGSCALMLQVDYRRGTKDSDLFETLELDRDIKARILELAGRDSEIHRQRRMYVEFVPNGLPFLPHAPNWRPLSELDSKLKSFTIEALDVVDVVISKLLRFNASDREDIEAMIDRQHVPHELFVERFRSAVAELAHDARASELPACVLNFHEIERDIFVTDETEIELPSWV